MNPVDEIRTLYYATTRQTIERDLARAVTLLKSLPDDAARERAAVYMDGLSQMRSEWAAAKPPSAAKRSDAPKAPSATRRSATRRAR